MNRRSFLASSPALLARSARRPNIVLLITDDQGYGDLSLHGNRQLETPNLDRIGREGIQFARFHVSPVCSPTRSCLMTGRYNYRTGVVDTYNGRSMMYPDEVTLAEALRGAGYRTGIFGKWHLGDNHPMRPIDQGFEEALVHNGGGIAQPSDPPDNRYFDPVLQHNGRPEKHTGYCTDIFTTAALGFIERRRASPFFCYLAMNAPHDPYQIDESYVAPFRAMGLDDRTAKVYGMVRNIDENAGRVIERLSRLGLERDTILMYMTDNGPQFRRFNAGMRGTKGTPYEGGIRVPFFVRWPARFQPGRDDRLAAHIDVFPTLLEACGVPLPRDRHIDGQSLLNPKPAADRSVIVQWMRGDEPKPFGGSAVLTNRWKLVNGTELYDNPADPAEANDLAKAEPEVVSRLRAVYERWFAEVAAERKFAPPRIWIGTQAEDPVILTRQDWRGSEGNWLARESIGWWEVDVRRAGRYDVRLTIHAAKGEGQIVFSLNGVSVRRPVGEGATEYTLRGVEIPAGTGRLEAAFEQGGQRFGVRYVQVGSGQ